MRIKKYEGKTWEEALQRMKEDLPKNAVILSLTKLGAREGASHSLPSASTESHLPPTAEDVPKRGLKNGESPTENGGIGGRG